MKEDNSFLFYFLSKIESLGAVSIRKIYEGIRPFSDLLIMEAEDICRKSDIHPRQAENIVNARKERENFYKEYCRLEKKGIRFITMEDNLFPKKLFNIYAAPTALYVKGSLPDSGKKSVAIVGSRACTAYGSGFAKHIAGILSKHDVELISGMAVGIDSYVHRGALEAGGAKNFAILACGADICYPQDNFDIYMKLSQEEFGGIISETPPGSPALKRSFPMRNRIISGLADILIVAEAGKRSGSLITAEHALEQGRDIMVLPGRITDGASAGCNRLIAGGADIITSVEEVLEKILKDKDYICNFAKKNINPLADTEKKVYSCLDLSPKHLEDIAKMSAMPIRELMTVLFQLEIRGYVRQVSGNYYSRSGDYDF